MPQVERFALALDGAGGAVRLDLAAPLPADAIGWRHLDEKHPEDIAWLRAQALPPVVVEALLAEETRPRFASFDGGDVIILRGISLNPGDEPEDMVALRCWFAPDRIITVSRRQVRSVHEVMDRALQGGGPTGAGSLLVVVAEALMAKIRELVRAMEEELEAREDQLLDGPDAGAHQSLRQARMRTIGLRRFLAPQMEALQAILKQPPGWLDDDNLDRLREVADQTSRAVETLGALREAVGTMQEQLAAAQAERMHKTSYVLTLIAGVFLPLNLVAALVGANVGGIPGSESTYGFLVLCLVMIVAGIAGALLFRWLRWF